MRIKFDICVREEENIRDNAGISLGDFSVYAKTVHMSHSFDEIYSLQIYFFPFPKY